MGKKKLINTWSTFPCAHRAVAQDNSHKYNPKGWHCCCAPSGLTYTYGDEMQNPMAVLRHRQGWAVPERSLESPGYLWQNFIFSCIMSTCSPSPGPPACCGKCRDKAIPSLRAVFNILENSVHEWFISRNKFNWCKNTGKAASQMLLVWLGCVFWKYLAFIALSGLLQIIYLPGGQDSVSSRLELELPTSNLKQRFSATTVFYL